MRAQNFLLPKFLKKVNVATVLLVYIQIIVMEKSENGNNYV